MTFPWLDMRKAANGKTVSENFMMWVGKTKVVDKSGLPLMLYHGTRFDFDAFDGSHSNKNTKTGVPNSTYVFTNSSEVASSYAGQRTPIIEKTLPTEELYDQWKALLMKHGPLGPTRDFYNLHAVDNLPKYKEGGQIIPVYLRVNKLLKVDAKKSNWNDILFKGDYVNSNEIFAYAKNRGYDGVVIRNVFDRQEGRGNAADTYAVFSATQIKSVFNSGLFLSNSTSLTDFEDCFALEKAQKAKKKVLQQNILAKIHASSFV